MSVLAAEEGVLGRKSLLTSVRRSGELWPGHALDVQNHKAVQAGWQQPGASPRVRYGQGRPAAPRARLAGCSRLLTVGTAPAPPTVRGFCELQMSSCEMPFSYKVWHTVRRVSCVSAVACSQHLFLVSPVPCRFSLWQRSRRCAVSVSTRAGGSLAS